LAGAQPRLCWGAYSTLSDPQLDLKSPTFKGKKEKGRGKGERGGKGKTRERRKRGMCRKRKREGKVKLFSKQKFWLQPSQLGANVTVWLY